MYLQPRCQNKDCPNHANPDESLLIKKGKDKRKNKTVQRYQCKICGQQFTSSSLQSVSFHNPELLHEIFLRYSSGYTVSRLCEELGISKTTALKMIRVLGAKCRLYHQELLATGFLATDKIYFDELVHHVHGKGYPVNIGLAVDVRYKRIVEIKIAESRIRGKLGAKIKREKGEIPEDIANRPNKAPEMVDDLLRSIKKALRPRGSLYSDKWVSYANAVARTIPDNVVYLQELSRTKLEDSADPQGLGRFRSVCAYLRTYVGALGRRTMNTAKTIQSLEDQLFITVARYNKYDLNEVLNMGSLKEDFFEREWRLRKEMKQLKTLVAVLTYPKFLKNQERIRKLKATHARKKAEKAAQLKGVS